MKFTLIRNATARVEYGGYTFLVDPMFSPKESRDSVGDINRGQRNPTVGLPMDPAQIVSGIDAVILTHLHPDHFDQAAADLIPKDIPFYVQNLQDKDSVRKFGIDKKYTVNMTLWTSYRDVKIIETAGLHGDSPKIMHVINTMANSSGFILEKEGEKRVWFTGDTVWCYGVEQALGYKPDVIVANVGAARAEGMRLIFDLPELKRIHETCPDAMIIADHLEAWNHVPLTRDEVRSYAYREGFSDHLLVPSDGETIEL